MDSWSYVCRGKGLISNETTSPSDSPGRGKNALMGWELKSPCSFGSIILTGQQAVENQDFKELGFHELVEERHLFNHSVMDSLSSRCDNGRIMNPIMPNKSSFSGEEDSNSKASGSVVDSSSRDSSLIDLKLGRFGDHTRDAHKSNFSKTAPILSSSESSTPPKRGRVAGLNSQATYCQVYGCNKDLSSSKDYHKRHKVCEVHSKTAKVIVNGIEQRFCQQCSRFHLLVEFDDGKRSCRKRLAGHNERRRKPQVGIHSGRTMRLLQSYNSFAGGQFQGKALMTPPFFCQDIVPSGDLHPQKYETSDWCKRLKVEDGTDYGPLSVILTTNANLHTKSHFPPCEYVKPFPVFNNNGASTSSGGTLNENNGQYTQDFGGTISGSRSQFQDNSIGSDNLTVFDAASTIHGLSEFPDSGCALSLLSCQSQNSSSHSSGIPMARQLVHTHYNVSRGSEKLVGLSSQASTSGVSNMFSSPGLSSVEGSHLSPILISDGSDAVNFDVTEGIYQGSAFVNSKDYMSCEGGSTMDLLQLSSQLQRVERQRKSMQLKQENDGFCCI